MDAAAIHRILVIGAGTSGLQIALQFSRFGYPAAIYDANVNAVAAGRQRLECILETLVADGLLASSEPTAILSRVHVTDDATVAAGNADLLIESVPENLQLKREVLARFHELCPAETIFTTNTSYLLPSSLAAASGRPDRFAAYHFHVPVWHANAVDVMPHGKTSPTVIEILCQLAWQIGQVPIRSRRENPGYVFNTMLHPLLLSALDLAARGVADFEDVDRAWMAITKMPMGPFGIVDEIGLDTVHKILETWGRWLPGGQAKGATALLEGYLQQQRLGRKSNHGFYRYPSPAFLESRFLSGQVGSGSPTPDSPDVTARYVPHAVAAPRTMCSSNDLRVAGGAIVLGRGSVADRLVARLHADGVAVARLPLDLAAMAVGPWMDRQWQVATRPHLFLVGESPGDPSTTGARQQTTQWFERHVRLPFAVAQAWFRHLNESPCRRDASLLGISRLGGKLGFDDQIQLADGGGLAGLVKSLAAESTVRTGRGLAARFVDFEVGVPADRCVDVALGELAGAQAEIVTGDAGECLLRRVGIEVGYMGRERYTICHRKIPASAATGKGRRPHGTWLVSGGSGGITMQVALAMARTFGLNLHVLGRTQLPDVDYLSWSPGDLEKLRKDVMRAAYRRGQKPNDAWRHYERWIEVQQAMRAYRDAGVSAAYHACDVADRDSVQRIVEQLRNRGQSVSGVLHGAGVERSTRLELKSLAMSDTILRPKTLGTKALIECTRGQPLEWFIAFGSLSGRFGGSGQADYAMANELMAKMVAELRQRSPGCCGLTIHWPGWKDIGMAAQPENRYLLEKAAHQLLPVDEGIRHFLREIQCGAPNAEVVIVSPEEIEQKLHAEDPMRRPDKQARSLELTAL